MLKKISLIYLPPLLLIGAIFSNPAYTQENSTGNTSLPQVKMYGQTEFISGGVGKDESDAIVQAGKAWPLTLELAQATQPRAEYISDVQVKIVDGKGNIILDADSAGPYLLVKLPPGKYALDATYNSVTLHRKLDLGSGSGKKISLIWPEARGN
jgi:hypothetical protein